MRPDLDRGSCLLGRLVPTRGFVFLRDWGGELLLALALVVSLVLWALEPVPHGHSYHLGVKVNLCLLLFWFFAHRGYAWMANRRVAYLIIFALGFYFAADRLTSIRHDSEILHTYQSLFETLDKGESPYVGTPIYHRAEFDAVRFGAFNYPPMEIWPYLAAAKLTGAWSGDVLTFSLIFIQILCCLVLRATFPREAWWKWAAFVPILVFFETDTNVAMSFLFVALVLFVLRKREVAPASWQRPALWLLIGLGLLTKFVMIPVAAAVFYSGWRFGDWRLWRTRLVDAAMTALVALLGCWPFSPLDVARETILFNLDMRVRAQLTTFYPNVLSGLLSWMDLSALYPLAAIGVLAAAIVHIRRLEAIPAVLVALLAFMLVATTPEPQYLPVILYTTLAVVWRKASPVRIASPG